MDEVYGRRASSSGSQPDPHGHNNCDECAESGNMVIASGFCENCSDFLCTSCIEQHKKARSLRHHNILKGKAMPTIKPRKSDVKKCTMHPTFGCSLCFTVGNRSCQNVALLSDLSRGVLELSETKLIMADFNNDCLKVFDMTSNSITQRRPLTAKPLDITKVPGCRVAVSFPNAKQIQFFKADQTLEPSGNIDVPSGCYGLHCAGDRLIVSNTSTPKFLILSMTGTFLQTIQYDPSGKELFRCPWHLAVSNDNKLIYVSDWGNHNLTCMTTTGVVQWVYRNEQLKIPYGLTTGENGSIYLCSWITNTIHVVSRDGTRLAIIQSNQSSILNPTAVSYTRNNRTLYVSKYVDDHITRLSLQ